MHATQSGRPHVDMSTGDPVADQPVNTGWGRAPGGAQLAVTLLAGG
ncbi:hypothetical protein ACFFRL_10570 [Agromyces hippuratus]